MNPGLVVKLRPTGPWRIGPDSGARNRVDTIYHSDTLYAAVTAALGRLGPLEEWLAATAHSGVPAVCFSSCFPFLEEIGFVVPPRTVWPPTSPALLSARVRWKSARFVPLGMVQTILAGHSLDESQWSVDAASECLVPAGRPGPFRTGMRSNAAVDRLSGSTERHATACIEFRAGAGLWTVVSFADEAAATRWLDPVKTAFRLLADSGFGGERSRGWGRSETPEFIEGILPEMILPAIVAAPEEPREPSAPPIQEPPEEEPAVKEPPAEPPMEEPPPNPEEPSEPPPREEAAVLAPAAILPLSVESAEAELARVGAIAPETPAESQQAPAAEASAEEAAAPAPEPPVVPEAEVPEPQPAVELSNEAAAAAPAVAPEPPVATPEAPSAPPAPEGTDEAAAPAVEAEPTPAATETTPTAEPAAETTAPAVEAIPPAPAETAPTAEPAAETGMIPPVPEPEPPPPDPEPQPQPAPPVPQPEPLPPEPAPLPEPGPVIPEPLPAAPPPVPAAGATHPHWLLSLFTPGPADSVDWTRGSYSVIARGGRIESPVRSGERKKQLPMVTEGSVLYASAPPAGSAPDVAPEGFVHPVYRAGFALAIPLPEVS